METAILARHGESALSVRGLVGPDAAQGAALTARGREQARELGRRLAGRPVDLCVTSAFRRARETADVALAGRDVPRVVVADLGDPRAGRFEGGPLADYRRWARAAGSAAAPPGGGESRRDLVARYARGYRAVLARPEPVVLVVGHSLPTAYVLEALEGRAPAPAIPLVDYATPYEVAAGALGRAVDVLETWLEAPTW